jgi:hypothetical protein
MEDGRVSTKGRHRLPIGRYDSVCVAPGIHPTIRYHTLPYATIPYYTLPYAMTSPWNVDYTARCITYDGYRSSTDRTGDVTASLRRGPAQCLHQLDLYLGDRYVFEGQWSLRLQSVVLCTDADSLAVAGYVKRGMHLRIEHSSPSPPWVTSMVRNEVVADLLSHIEHYTPREGQVVSLAPYIVCGTDVDDLMVTLFEQGFLVTVEPELEEVRHPVARVHEWLEVVD